MKSSYSEKVAAMEDNVFWKSGHSEKVALQKKWVVRNIVFIKNGFFPKCCFSETVDAVQKYLLRKSSSSLDIFILSNPSAKKVALPTIN